MKNRIDAKKVRNGLIDSALEFVHQDTVIREFRRQLRKCSFRESADWSCNDPGTPECRFNIDLAVEDYCEQCGSAVRNEVPYKAALRARSAAKRKMRRLAAQAEIAAVEA